MPVTMFPIADLYMDTPQPATKSIWRTPNHYLYLEPGTGYTLPSTPIGRDAGDHDAPLLTSIWTPSARKKIDLAYTKPLLIPRTRYRIYPTVYSYRARCR
jgi:hypothetical protein